MRPDEPERGPKGGRKHQPGRGHDRKSKPQSRARFTKRARRKRLLEMEALRKAWELWDGLSADAKKILKGLKPKKARPSDEAVG